MTIRDLIAKSRQEEPLTHADLVQLLEVPPVSPDGLAILAEGRRISDQVTGGRAEVHGQFALDLAPCNCNCMWCSFARVNGVFTEKWRIGTEEAVQFARNFEAAGANAVLMMTTVHYPFGRLLEVAQEVRRALDPQTVLIVNTGDRTPQQALQMKDAGIDGAYHARRLREGIENEIDPADRLATMRALRDVGLWLGTCVEPIGPEHSADEIAELILFTASLRPAFSGAARRIPVPGTEMASRGIISELRMTQCVAITRMAMPRETRGNCTHEPCALGALGGASLFWAEVGANPRDDHEKTEEGRGRSVADCRHLFEEADCEVLAGSSEHFRQAPPPAPGTDTMFGEAAGGGALTGHARHS